MSSTEILIASFVHNLYRRSNLQLLLPIILGEGLAWIASGLIHMLIKYHNSDHQQLSNEAEVMSAVQNESPNLGIHTFPSCASLVPGPGAEYMVVFRFVSAVGFLTFGWAVVPYSIWFGHQWSTTAKYLLDALIYGLVIAGSFAWLWLTLLNQKDFVCIGDRSSTITTLFNRNSERIS